MCPKFLLSPLPSPQYFKIGNGDLMKATHSGRLGQWKGVLYSKDCSFNLMPVHWLRKVVYENGTCTIYHGKGKLRKKLISGICQVRADELKALPCRHFPLNPDCSDCVGQQARRSQSMPEYRKATAFLGRVYPDRIGPTSRSLDGFNSTLIMVDEFSHMVWLENMKVGQELCPVAEHLIYLAETEQINGPRSQVRCIRGDFEFFKNNGLVDVAEQRRIRLENSTPHAHKKGVGETVVGHISRFFFFYFIQTGGFPLSIHSITTRPPIWCMSIRGRVASTAVRLSALWQGLVPSLSGWTRDRSGL